MHGLVSLHVLCDCTTTLFASKNATRQTCDDKAIYHEAKGARGEGLRLKLLSESLDYPVCFASSHLLIWEGGISSRPGGGHGKPFVLNCARVGFTPAFHNKRPPPAAGGIP